MTAERIRELRREARQINARQKQRTKGMVGWHPMSAEEQVDFERFMAIQVEIEKLKATSK